MFGRIAGRYDLLNRVLSFGIDRSWRRAVLREAGPLRDRLVVDACCGTGDLARALAREGAHVLGVDFTPQMLALAQRKSSGGGATYALGDLLRLPVRDRGADLATVAFGIRNAADLHAGLRELARAVRPGGKVLVLEFTLPRGRWIGPLYRLYLTRVLPLVGGALSGDAGAYRYLRNTVLDWPDPERFAGKMEGAGMERCAYRLLSGGIACLHWGTVRA